MTVRLSKADQNLVTAVKVHFDGWHTKWDEWVPLDSRKLRRAVQSQPATTPDDELAAPKIKAVAKLPAPATNKSVAKQSDPNSCKPAGKPVPAKEQVRLPISAASKPAAKPKSKSVAPHHVEKLKTKASAPAASKPAAKHKDVSMSIPPPPAANSFENQQQNSISEEYEHMSFPWFAPPTESVITKNQKKVFKWKRRSDDIDSSLTYSSVRLRLNGVLFKP